MAVHVVTGPPAAGKTTHIRRHAKPGDIRIDLDELANHLAGLPADTHQHTVAQTAIAKAARTAAIDTALKHADRADVWIIHTKPGQADLDRYQSAGANIITCDPGKDIVMKRCREQRSRGALIAAAQWYDAKPAADIIIYSDKAGTRTNAAYRIDASKLPNPAQVNGFAPRTGRNPQVAGWLLEREETQQLLDREVARVAAQRPATVLVTCSAGRHRSVAVAEALADELDVRGIRATVEHKQLGKAKRGTTTEKGLGWGHQKERRRLLALHVDGSPCWWCGKPMFKDAAKNFDGRPLAADHIQARVNGGKRAGRLLHSRCNSSRKDGSRDHLRPALESSPAPSSGYRWAASSGFSW